MPVIARFYGIIIKMYFSQSEHGAHIFMPFMESTMLFSILPRWK